VLRGVRHVRSGEAAPAFPEGLRYADDAALMVQGTGTPVNPLVIH
jgi:hypothetical protein